MEVMSKILKEVQEVKDARVSEALDKQEHHKMAELRRTDELYHAMTEILQVLPNPKTVI